MKKIKEVLLSVHIPKELNKQLRDRFYRKRGDLKQVVNEALKQYLERNLKIKKMI